MEMGDKKMNIFRGEALYRKISPSKSYHFVNKRRVNKDFLREKED